MAREATSKSGRTRRWGRTAEVQIRTAVTRRLATWASMPSRPVSGLGTDAGMLSIRRRPGARGSRCRYRGGVTFQFMDALLLKEYMKLEMVQMDEPEIGADDILVRVRACGICGSDVHGLDGSTGRRIPPLVMGHEAAGAVERVGANVRDLAKGDRVTFDSTIYCGHCAFCARGDVNLCDNRMVLGVSPGEY